MVLAEAPELTTAALALVDGTSANEFPADSTPIPKASNLKNRKGKYWLSQPPSVQGLSCDRGGESETHAEDLFSC